MASPLYDVLVRIATALERLVDLIEATAFENDDDPPPLPKC